ncbi:hypothetical protein AB6A40_006769 [Gnathostoma spinigerum]|uniref:Uncharacterized protein n=1 Tax=Gnathostoma spinigerum TaxID=75299 RepID=A0ABD6EJA9_9BILA
MYFIRFRLVDVRQGRLCHSLYASEKNPSIKGVYSSSPVASIRCFAISPNENQCAVALTNGTLSILDMRTGNLVASSNRIHSDTLELRWISDRLLVSSHLDHPCICWSTSPLRISRRLLDSGSMLLIHREQLVTVQSSARLRIYEKLSPKSEVKLKSDLFPGSVSSVAYLPLNKMFLFGFSSGHIRLFC